jgi:hypothetical protein
MLGKRENAQTVAAALLERDRLGLAGLSSATASLMTSDFDAEPVFRFRVGFALVCGSASVETDTARVTAETTFALDFRPRPNALAIVARCSE